MLEASRQNITLAQRHDSYSIIYFQIKQK